MTAPTRTRSKPTTAPPERKTGRKEQRKDGSGRSRTAGTRSAAAERAYARRAQRVDQARRTGTGESGTGTAQPSGARAKFRLRMPRSRASFVLLIMAMLATGVVVTLWLTTQAIAGSYKLERLHERNAALAERVANLERVVTKRESATWLAEQARQLGMVPGGTPAKLVVRPDGSVNVVGEPKKVAAPAPPPAPAPQPPQPESQPAESESASDDESSTPDEQQPQGDDSAQAPRDQESAEQESSEQESSEQGSSEQESAAQGTQAAGEGG